MDNVNFKSRESSFSKFKNAFLRAKLKNITYEQKKTILNDIYNNSFKSSNDSVVKVASIQDLINKINSSNIVNKDSLIKCISIATEKVTKQNIACKALNVYLNNLEEKFSPVLGNRGKIILKTYFETMKASAYYWFPKRLGGSGQGYNILQKLMKTKKEKNSEIPPIGAALISDASSMSIGMIGVAVTGAFLGPVGWGALAVVAGESAANSGLAAIVAAL